MGNKKAKYSKTIFLTISMCFVLIGISAQQASISGTVSDSQGQPVPGASVVVKGTATGVAADFDGNYNIGASSSDILVFSSIGYATKEVTVGGQTTINISLEEAASQLDEVVVTALGIKRESKALGYALTEVEGEQITKAQETNVVNSLAGKVAGVQINSSSGQSGSSARITIRGSSSIQFNNQPLFVIDGMPIDNTEFGNQYGAGTNSTLDIDPNSIESISVLKGASAAALYGSRAANGVILITTKSGAKGVKPRVTFTQTTSMDNIYEIPLQTTFGQGQWNNNTQQFETVEGTANTWGPPLEESGLEVYDKWQAFKTGYTFDNNLTVTGGGAKNGYMISLGNYHQTGTLSPTEFDRTNFVSNFNVDINNWMTINAGLKYSRTDGIRLWEDWSPWSFMNTFLASPPEWSPYPVLNEDGSQRVYRASRSNYIWLQDNSYKKNERDRFIPSLSFSAIISDALSFNGRVGIDYYLNKEVLYLNSGGTGAFANGLYWPTDNDVYSLESDFMLNYTKSFSDFDLDLMVGNNIYNYRRNQSNVQGTDFIIPEWESLDNVQSKIQNSSSFRKRSISLYGQAVLSWRDQIYYTFTGRNDWSSTLPMDNNSYFYSGHSLSLLFSEMLKVPNMDYGKFRASYAEVGNDAPIYSINPSYVLATQGHIMNNARPLTFPINGIGSYLLGGDAGNPNLRNELTSEYEFGLEMKFFQDRLGFDASYYDRTSTDQVVFASIASTTGFTSAISNIGEIKNKGVELMFYGSPIRTPNFEWKLTGNWYQNKSLVVKLSDEFDNIGLGTGSARAIEGEPYPTFWGNSFVRDENGNRIVVDDPDSPRYGYYLQGIIGQDVTGILKKNEPDWRAGIRNTLSYKNLTLTALLDMQFGGYIVNFTDFYLLNYGMSPVQEDRPLDNTYVWPGVKGRYDAEGNLVTTGEVNDIPAEYQRGWQNFSTDESYLQPSDYIKLRDVSLSYNFSQDILKNVGWLDGVVFTLSGRNLWRWFDDDFTGSDPEVSQNGSGNAQGWATYPMPSTKSYNFGVKLTF